jgi:hypothetical protein
MGTNQLDVFYSNTLTDRILVGTTTGVIQCLHETELKWPLVHVNLAEAEQKPRPEIKQEGLEGAPKPAAKPDGAQPKPAAGGVDPFGAGGAQPEPGGADPFGGGAAPQPAPGGADPFGEGGAKPEPGGADPFGGGAAPQPKPAGAGAADDDPFS